MSSARQPTHDFGVGAIPARGCPAAGHALARRARTLRIRAPLWERGTVPKRAVPLSHPCPLRPPTASSGNTPARGGFLPTIPSALICCRPCFTRGGECSRAIFQSGGEGFCYIIPLDG